MILHNGCSAFQAETCDCLAAEIGGIITREDSYYAPTTNNYTIINNRSARHVSMLLNDCNYINLTKNPKTQSTNKFKKNH